MDLLTALIGRPEKRYDPLIADPYFWFMGQPMYGLNQTLQGDVEQVPDSFEGYVNHAYKSSGVVFACEYVRLSVFSQARFMWQNVNQGTPGDLYYSDALDVLRRPKPGWSTGDLLTRLLVHADFAGNAFILRGGKRITLLRPDWVDIVFGVASSSDGIDVLDDPAADVVGYLYHPGGRRKSSNPIPYTVDDVAHFAPIPDPLAMHRGMSWMTPVVRDIVGDKQATVHKNKFYEQGATPNMVVKGQWTDPDVMRKWTTLFREQHEGETNAYKTLILGAGMDATVVGNNFQQLDFKAVQGAAETRIAAASGVGAVVAQLSEGLAGSALNSGNYQAARRRTADITFRPLWDDTCETIERIVPAPRNSKLWYDERRIAFLQDDARDAADIEFVKAQTARQLIDGGFDPASVVDAVVAQDMSLLSHTGKLSVQLQDPNAVVDPAAELSAAAAAARGLPEDFKARFDAVGLLIRSGFKPQAALAAVDLDPIDHFDLLPVTLQNPDKVLGDGSEPNMTGDEADAAAELNPDQEPANDPDIP